MICALVTAIALGIVGERVLLVGFPVGTLLVLLVIMCGWLWLRLRRLSVEVDAMRHNTLAFGTFETSLAERLSGIDRAVEKRDSQIAQMEEMLGEARKDIGEIRATPAPSAEVEKPTITLTAPITNDAPVTEDMTTPELKSAIRRDALSLHLEPIVTLPSRSPRHFLLSMRMQDEKGAWLDDKTFAEITLSGRLWPQIDSKMLFAAVRIQRRLGAMSKRTSLLCSIHEQTLSARRTFEPILQFAKANLSLAGSLAFLVDAQDYEQLNPTAKGRLGDLVDAGFQLALGGFTSFRRDPKAMADQGFGFLLVSSKVFEFARTEPENAGINWAGIGSAFQQAGAPLVITGMSNADGLPDLFESDIHLASGPLFAPPRPLRDELKDEAEKRA